MLYSFGWTEVAAIGWMLPWQATALHEPGPRYLRTEGAEAACAWAKPERNKQIERIATHFQQYFCTRLSPLDSATTIYRLFARCVSQAFPGYARKGRRL